MTLFGPARPTLPEPFASMPDASLCVAMTGIVGRHWNDGPQTTVHPDGALGSYAQCRVWRCPPGMLAPQAEAAREYCKAKYPHAPAIDFDEAWTKLGLEDSLQPGAAGGGE